MASAGLIHSAPHSFYTLWSLIWPSELNHPLIYKYVSSPSPPPSRPTRYPGPTARNRVSSRKGRGSETCTLNFDLTFPRPRGRFVIDFWLFGICFCEVEIVFGMSKRSSSIRDTSTDEENFITDVRFVSSYQHASCNNLYTSIYIYVYVI